MNNAIITTKGSNGVWKARMAFGSIIFIVVGLIGFKLSIHGGKINAFEKSKPVFIDYLTLIMPFLLLFLGLYFLYIAFGVAGRTYLDVYPDRMTGKGFQGSVWTRPEAADFSIDNSHITNVTTNGGMIYVNTPAGKYAIYSNSQKAREVFDYYSRLPR